MLKSYLKPLSVLSLLLLATCQTLPTEQEVAATAAAIPDPNDLRRVINENRFFTLRPKARNLVLENWDKNDWSLATTQNGCPSPWHISWGVVDQIEARDRSLQRCSAHINYFLPHQSKFTNKSCGCTTAVENRKLFMSRIELPQYLWSPFTWFSVEGGNLKVQYGMAGVEKAAIVAQNMRFIDREGNLFCEGRFDPKEGRQGYFQMKCENSGLEGEGDVTVKNLLVGQRHSVGLAQSKEGARFAFVTRLMPDELRVTYPEFFDLKFYK
jgi:hypothetical protein